jgi:hypothetical protein
MISNFKSTIAFLRAPCGVLCACGGEAYPLKPALNEIYRGNFHFFAIGITFILPV